MRCTIVVAVLLGLAGTAAAQDADGSGSGSDDDSGLGLPDDGTTTTQPSDDTDATPATPDPAMAKKLVAGAQKFEKEGDKLRKRKKAADAAVQYDRAIAAYDKAYEMAPSAAVLVAGASVAAKEGKWAEAAQRYQKAIAETNAPLDDRAKTRAQAALDAAMEQIGVVTLTIVPDGAAVAVDGADVGTTPLAQPLWLAPGEHTLAIHADGYVDFQTKLAIEAGSESERRFELKPVPVIVEKPQPPPPPPPAPPPPPPAPSKMLVWVGLGVTGLGAGIATVTGVLAISKHSTFAGPSTSAADRKAAQSSGRTLAHTTDALFGVAIVAAAATAYYYLEVYRPKLRHRDEVEHVAWTVVPSAGRGEGGLVLAGWW